MSEAEKAATLAYIAAWKRAGPELEKQRRADIRAANTAQAMRIFTGSAHWYAKNRPELKTSGLIEQQRLFMKLRQA